MQVKVKLHKYNLNNFNNNNIPFLGRYDNEVSGAVEVIVSTGI